MQDMEVDSVQPVSESKQYNEIQVNDIVKREKARAGERARAELEAKHAEELAKVRGEMSNSSPQLDAKQIKEEVMKDFYADLEKRQEEMRIDEEKRQLESMADQYKLKMAKKPEHIEDFDEIMGSFDPSAFPAAVLLASSFDNLPEMMHELASNPTKLAQIDSLALKSPGLAKRELDKLSKSILANMTAKQNHMSAPPPLSRTKSSNVGGDTGPLTLKDYKKAPWLRG